MAARRAARHGRLVRPQLPAEPVEGVGGLERGTDRQPRPGALVDVMVGNEEDFTACLGFDVEGVDEQLTEPRRRGFAAMIETSRATYPELSPSSPPRCGPSRQRAATTGAPSRGPTAASQATQRPDLEILDRVGGGDSFASGLIYGLLTGRRLQSAVEYGAAHGALAMTTPGDTSMATLAEVRSLVEGRGARVRR